MLVLPVAIFTGAYFSAEMVLILVGVTQALLSIPLWHLFYNKMLDMSFNTYLKGQFFPFLVAVAFFWIYEITFIGEATVILQTVFSIILALTLCIYAYFTLSEFKDFIKVMISKYVWNIYL